MLFLLDGSLRRVGVRMTRPFSAFVVLLGLVLSAGPARAQFVWTQQSPANSPPSRYAAGIASNPSTGIIVIFGGEGSTGSLLNDTWVWDGTNWTQENPVTTPPARIGATMAYDPGSGDVLLFGGSSSNGLLNDTWLWDGTNWTQQSPANSPSVRVACTMATDTLNGQVVMFGGSDSGSGSSAFNDTWVWSHGDWAQLSPSTSPAPRFQASMAEVRGQGEIVLFGGLNTSRMNDTWVWSESSGTWTQASPATVPAPRTGATMDFDRNASRIVLFGGFGATVLLNDTWTWDGMNWTQLSPTTAPPARYFGGLAYDESTGVSLLFGGTENTGQHADTWTLEDTAPNPTITFAPNPNAQAYGTAITAGSLDATAAYNNTPVTGIFSYTTTVSGNPVSLTAGTTVLPVGSYIITANFTPSTTAYTSASGTAQYSVTPAGQSITFGPIPAQLVGATIPLNATATSQLPVSFQTLTPTVCSVVVNSATMLTPGTCTIEAMQAGGGNYSAATPVSVSFPVEGFTLTALPGSETIRRGVLGAFLVEVKSVNGFAGNVMLTCSGGPAKSVCGDFPQTLSVKANGTGYAVAGILFRPQDAAGTYTITFAGTSSTDRSTTTAKFTAK